MWYMFPVQCEGLRINHLTLLLIVTMPCACWCLWRAYDIEDFKWRLHFEFGLSLERLFWERYVLKGQIAFEGHWRLQSWTLDVSAPTNWVPIRVILSIVLYHCFIHKTNIKLTFGWHWQSCPITKQTMLVSPFPLVGGPHCPINKFALDAKVKSCQICNSLCYELGQFWKFIVTQVRFVRNSIMKQPHVLYQETWCNLCLYLLRLQNQNPFV